jgi:glycosyltransferase involved in cell wall biosynthesis
VDTVEPSRDRAAITVRIGVMMGDSQRCSVIAPTYNRARLLRHTLKSLVGQRMPKEQFEVIVVDDGSTDGTPELVESFREQLDLHYVQLPPRRALRRPGA